MDMTSRMRLAREAGWWAEVVAMLGGGILLAVTGRNEPIAVQVLVACFVPVLLVLGGAGVMMKVRLTKDEYAALVATPPDSLPPLDSLAGKIVDVSCPRCHAMQADPTYWECGSCDIGWHDCGMPDCDRRRRIDEFAGGREAGP